MQAQLFDTHEKFTSFVTRKVDGVNLATNVSLLNAARRTCKMLCHRTRDSPTTPQNGVMAICKRSRWLDYHGHPSEFRDVIR